MEQVLRSIIEGVSNNYGKQFFETIALKMHEAIGSDYTFIAKLNGDEQSSATICLVADGKLVDNIEYALKGTPCAEVADNSICLYPKDVATTFPDDQLLIDMGVQGYIGVPLVNSQGSVVGLSAALYRAPIEDPEFTKTVFQIFSGRISAELERMEYETELENAVKERTKDAEETLAQLKQTQDIMIQQEKLAALGGVVAGFAHEINTPLGVSNTAQSLREAALKTLNDKFQGKTMTRTDLENFLKDSEEIDHTINVNLARAIDLIQNFKHAAVDRTDSAVHSHNLHQLMEQQRQALAAEFRRLNTECVVEIPENIEIVTHGSDLTQIIHNLTMNACAHAFEGIASPKIVISAKQESDDTIVLRITDNGIGISDEVKDKVFEPFVTTGRDKGNTGLGMNIVLNLVTKKLKGTIELNEEYKDGAEWVITLPSKIEGGEGL